MASFSNINQESFSIYLNHLFRLYYTHTYEKVANMRKIQFNVSLTQKYEYKQLK